MSLPNIDPSKEVIITKLAESKPGLVEVGYWVKGKISDFSDLAVDSALWVERTENSETTPRQEVGMFNTSKIERIIPTAHGIALITRNSVWLLENTE